jgi:hypothetical protein
MEYHRIEYETKIIQAVRKDNVNGNTVHFHWDRASFGGNYVLRVVTHNIKTNQNFLMKQVDAPTEHECLLAMVKYVEESFKDENSYTIIWSDGAGGEPVESYFRGVDDDEVTTKFIHDNTRGVIIDIILNPLT